MKYIPRLAAALVPVMVVVLAYAHTPYFLANQYDDTYITYRYAINLAQGHGLVFNVGEHTDSASSFLYTLVLALSWALGVKNLEFAGAALGLVSLGAICLGTYRLACHLCRNKGVSLLLALACGLNGFLSGWALSGMETIPWAALITGSIYALVVGAPASCVALLIGAAAFTRLEGIFLVLPWCMSMWRRRSPPSHYAPALGIVLALAAFYAIKHQYYGVWVSHAFKMKEIALYYQADPGELLNNWKRFAAVPFALGLIGIVSKRHWPVSAYLLLSFVSLATGPKSDWSRYSVHLLPIFYAYGAVPIARMLPPLPRQTWRQAAVAGLVVLLLMQSWRGWAFNWRNMNELAQHQACLMALGRHIATAVPIGQYIASSDLGAISYQAINHRFVDLIALTSSDVLALYARGENADSLLEAKQVRLMADTFSGQDTHRLDTLLAQFPKVREPSRFRVDLDKSTFQCSADNRLQFMLAGLTRR